MILDGYEFEYRGETARVKLERYVNKRMRIDIVSSDGVPMVTLTTNVPEQELKDREIIVKTWSENEHIAQRAIRLGLFENTRKTVPSTFVHAQIWKIKDDVVLPKE